ncbi:hypothetical protein PIB30_051187 [Stylosanthes scabra]|uniref:Uncharacterized protein n=1 Tax=Stylosanthes scabra TaxID=79078 RepID=A0ABU6WG22_9FABA|nr:hypothetical protein [Stylosanthes scabra]
MKTAFRPRWLYYYRRQDVGNNKSPFKIATAFPLPHSAETPFSLLPFSLTTAPNLPSLLIFSLLGAPFAVPSPPLYSCDIGSLLPLSPLFWTVGIVR